MKRGKKILIIVLIVVMMIFVANLIIKSINKNSNNSEDSNLASVKVTTGNLKVMVSGNGKVEFSQREELKAKIVGEVNKINVNEGDLVKKGDIIVQIDSSDAISAKEDEIKLLDNRIKLQEVTVKEQAKALDELRKTKENTIITASHTGILSEFIVREGDSVFTDQRIGIINDNSKLKLTLPFEKAKTESIKIGQQVLVYLIDYLDKDIKTQAKITSIKNSQDGGQVIADVEIVLQAMEGYEAGVNASFSLIVDGNFIPPLRTGKLEWIDNYTLSSSGSGKVKEVLKESGDKVIKGDAILVLENKNIDLEVERALYTYKGAELEHESLVEKMSKLNDDLDKLISDSLIDAPIDGIVYNLNIKVGDEIAVGTVIAVVSTDSQVMIPIQIDELDIVKVKQGQYAEINLDALEEKTFVGTVDEVALEGVNVTGIGSFEVVIRLPDSVSNEMKPGMSANVEIIVSEKDDTLILPIEAVRKIDGQYMVKKKMSDMIDETNKDQEDMTAIKIGLVSDSFVEILEGLSEGDEVIIAGQEPNYNYMMPGMGRY